HDGARRELADTRALFDAERAKIVDIYRAGALRKVAEAACAMDDAGTASTLYERALEEGVVNPNSRPRADDLVATCTSMAVRAVEPNARLRARTHEICDKLGNPW